MVSSTPGRTLVSFPRSGFLPWLIERWAQVRQALSQASVSNEEREALLLVEFAALRVGEPMLNAKSIDDLDDRLDAMVSSGEILHVNALLAPLVAFDDADVPSTSNVAALVETAIGHAQARHLEAAAPLIDAWLHAQMAVTQAVGRDITSSAAQKLADAGPDLLKNPAFPVVLAQCFDGAMRAVACLFAILDAATNGRRIEPWLAHAIVDRFIRGARAHLRLLAAIPGVDVPPSVLPAAERLDMTDIIAQHTRARAEVDEQFERAVLGLERNG